MIATAPFRNFSNFIRNGAKMFQNYVLDGKKKTSRYGRERALTNLQNLKNLGLTTGALFIENGVGWYLEGHVNLPVFYYARFVVH